MDLSPDPVANNLNKSQYAVQKISSIQVYYFYKFNEFLKLS